MTSSLIPRPARFEVTRPALLTHLAQALDAQLVLLAAPSGYGKSTVLAQYARSTPRATAWCRLTEAHTGPLEVTRLIAQTLEPHTGVRDDLLNPDPRTPDQVLRSRLAQALAEVDVNIDLIVDPVEDDQLARWLIELALSLNEGHRVLMGRYSAEGLRLARSLANGQSVILDAENLQFSAAETTSLLEARGVSLTADVLDQLQGWPAGVALSAAGPQRHVNTQDLVEEPLEGLPESLRSGLADLAVLDIWSEDDARQLGIDLPEGWLAQVQRAGLPLLPLGHHRFQPHQLLLRVLERQLQRDHLRQQRLQFSAAALAERRGEIRRAARLYALAGAVPEFLRLAGPLTAQFRGRGEHRFTRELLEALPGEHLPPELRARLAWALIETGESGRGEITLQTLREAGQLFPSGFASLAMIHGRRGEVDQQYRYTREGLALLPVGEVEPALLWPLAYAALKRDQLPEARAAAVTLMTWARTSGDQVRLAEAWQLQAVVSQHAQDVPAAQQALKESGNIYAHLGWSARAAMIRLDEAELAFRTGDLTAAWTALGHASVGVDDGHHLYHVRRLLLRASLNLWSGQAQRASDALDEAEMYVVAGSLRLQHQHLLLIRADVLIAQGHMEQARTLLATLQPGQPLMEAYHRVLTALLPGELFSEQPVAVRGWADASLRVRGLALLSQQRPELVAETRRSPLWTHRPEHRGGPQDAVTRSPTSVPKETFRKAVLSITALGDLTAQLDGQVVPIALAKSRQLLVWLALHGSGSRDEMVTALWDGSAEERHVEYFRVAVRRLRSALKTVLTADFDPLPYHAGRYRLSPELHVQLDARPALPLPTDLQTLQAEFQVYCHPFMPGLEADWIEEVRERCAQRAVTLGLNLAKDSGSDAATVYQRVVQFDCWCDAAHQGLIRALMGRQRRAEGEQALRTYTQLLREEFGVTPDDSFLQEMKGQGLSTL